MEVIAWQLLVFGSVAGVTALQGSRAGFFVAIGWSIWTLAMLFYAPLILIQLGVAWGALGLFKTLGDRRDTIRNHEQKIANLEQTIASGLADYSDQEKKRIRSAAAAGNYDFIKDADHRRELDQALVNAQERLVISSGWISSRVIDRRFCKQIDQAMRRGVVVTIYYGWQSYNRKHESDSSTVEALNSLEKLKTQAKKRSYRGSLEYCEVATHRKYLIVDHQYVIVGSFNWLMNREVRNAEISIKIYDGELGDQLRLDVGDNR